MSRETLDLSATQVSLVQECQRKYAISYICGIRQPTTESQLLGTEVDDEQIQPYLKYGRPFELEKKAGKIAAAGQHLLPDPALSLQKKLFVQKFFRIPSLSAKPGEPAPFAFLGYKDMWLPYGGMPSFPADNNPVVSDSKTTKDFRWAKTEAQLKTNEQAILYSWNALYERRADKIKKVNLDWVYFRTTEPYKAQSRAVTLDAEHVYVEMKRLDDVGKFILELRHAAPPHDSSDEEKMAYALSLPPNPAMCGQYGGCPFRSHCGMDVFFDSLDDNKKRLPVMGGTLDLFESLPRQEADPVLAKVAAKVAAQDELLGINPPRTQAPPPAPTPAPEAESAPEEAPKAKRGRKPKAETAPVDALDCTGFEFEVVFGREARSPDAGEGYEVGPFSVKGKVPPGGNLIDAMYQAHKDLCTVANMCRGDRKASFEKGSE